ncbi:MAG TPA: hypothetical protein VI544_02220 [Candidatus Nanoarchaeia archaeon]|nr:hypothetical protein [Candidatus Nanoarchaeia archaeon]
MLEFKKMEEVFVDAIENGKIVRVSEDYAKQEGLLILRKSAKIDIKQTPEQKKGEESRRNKGFIGMEDLRRPLSSRGNELLNELVENFHWVLARKRKDKFLTRKKVAVDIGEDELNVRMIESGVLPADNFVLINKLESYYGITLRKNKTSGSIQPLRQIVDFNKNQSSSISGRTSVVARTPKWANKFKRDEPKGEPEIEIIDEDLGADGGKNAGQSGKSSSHSAFHSEDL